MEEHYRVFGYSTISPRPQKKQKLTCSDTKALNDAVIMSPLWRSIRYSGMQPAVSSRLGKRKKYRYRAPGAHIKMFNFSNCRMLASKFFQLCSPPQADNAPPHVECLRQSFVNSGAPPLAENAPPHVGPSQEFLLFPTFGFNVALFPTLVLLHRLIMLLHTLGTMPVSSP